MAVHRDLVLAFALVASACSIDNTATASHAIIGGSTSEPSEFPATGMLVNRGQLLCTATLIAPDVALTAGHCLHAPVFGTLGFTLDTDTSDGTSDVIPITIYHPHPDFDDGVADFVDLAVRNDIGILILQEPVQGVVPEQIDMLSFETAIDTGNLLAMCGYGRVFWTGSVALKRDAEVVVDRTEPFEFSTTAADPQPCTGDSGAPLFVDSPSGRRIVGVVSRAVGTSRMCDTGAIITRVAPYAAWIAAASQDRDPGCSAGGGGGSLLPLGLLWALHALRRRRRPPR